MVLVSGKLFWSVFFDECNSGVSHLGHKKLFAMPGHKLLPKSHRRKRARPSCDDDAATGDDDSALSTSQGSDCAVHVEVARYRAMLQLQQEFMAALQPLVATTRNQARKQRSLSKAFEEWLYARRAAAAAAAAATTAAKGVAVATDPVLPSGKTATTDETLQRKLQAAGLASGEAASLCATIGTLSSKLATQVQKVASNHKSHGTCPYAASPSVATTTTTTTAASKGTADATVELSLDGVGVCCRQQHYERLQRLHERRRGGRASGAGGGAGQAAVEVSDRLFNQDLFRVLLRYMAAQGCHNRGGRMQVSVAWHPPLPHKDAVATFCFCM